MNSYSRSYFKFIFAILALNLVWNKSIRIPLKLGKPTSLIIRLRTVKCVKDFACHQRTSSLFSTITNKEKPTQEKWVTFGKSFFSISILRSPLSQDKGFHALQTNSTWKTENARNTHKPNYRSEFDTGNMQEEMRGNS